MMRELRIHISSAFDPLSSAHKAPRCILEEILGGHGVFYGVNKGGKEEEREITLGNCGVSLLHQRDLVVNLLVRSSEIVFINFYADWCRFSQILAPVFEEAEKKIREEFPDTSRVTLAKVDCDAESGIAQQYHISKYPTLKLVRNGQLLKKEYRGQRSVDALAQYIRDQLRSSIQEHTTLESLDEVDEKKRHIIGYFADKSSENYRLFTKLASSLRDDCQFHEAVGAFSEPERSAGDSIVYRAPNTKRQDIPYQEGFQNYEALLNWATSNCVPIVREITFENAEELTEEGLPFLILFHKADDSAIVEKFTQTVQRELLSEKSGINFLTADGAKFRHPLHHLGKSEKDLPILAIDSFRHMYLFPNNAQDMDKPGLLKQFVADLHSGKLHREFHHGPDPTTAYPTPPPPPESQDTAGTPDEAASQHIPHDQKPQEEGSAKQPTSPPESVFKNLAPSRNRYTVLRDEL
ncbi:hypothetical protein FSP39_005138 [Pinctada imbricata]|uniref:Thioredoxin domain-containing protein n=1 Tax=Pinctada imbricata TaxID=66713 RepID=A0AA88XCL5_PINIB|nr:hypothetical protein FSP39_005138 [Pinctada imbricata]